MGDHERRRIVEELERDVLRRAWDRGLTPEYLQRREREACLARMLDLVEGKVAPRQRPDQ